MKIWERLFSKTRVKETPAPTTEPEDTFMEPEENNVEPDMRPYNYGLDSLGLYLMSQDYGWTDPDQTHKKVILTNVEDCREKLHFMSLMSAWRETGHSEWEALMSGWFVQAVIDALEAGETEADITHIFNRDYLAYGNKTFTQQQVYDHLIPWFDIVEETDDVLKLRLHI